MNIGYINIVLYIYSRPYKIFDLNSYTHADFILDCKTESKFAVSVEVNVCSSSDEASDSEM